MGVAGRRRLVAQPSGLTLGFALQLVLLFIIIIIIIIIFSPPATMPNSIIIIKDIYIAQVRKSHKCAMSAEMAVWLRRPLTVYVSIAIYITNYQDS